jgi:Na+/melibiose symporter-like transporter
MTAPARAPAPDARAPAAPRRTDVSLWTLLGYGSGNFGFALLGLVVAVNLQFFYTDTVGLAAGYVSWALLFARCLDAFFDPVMGYVSDRTHTRMGRRRPWLLAAALPLALAFYALFAPPDFGDPAGHQAAILAYMTGFYTLTFCLWTVGAIPYYSLGAELSDDYHERTRIISVRELFALAGLLAATILPAYLIYSRGGREGYASMGAVLGIGIAVFMVASGLAVRERPEFQGRPALSPYAGVAETFRNPHFRPLLAAFTLAAIAAAVPAVLVIYVSVYIIGTPPWWEAAIPGWLPTWSYYLLLYFGCGVLSLPIWTRCAGRYGKRATWAISLVLAMATSAACFWLDDGTVGLFSALLVFGGASFGNMLALPPSMVADVIDWDEANTSLRREGAYFAVWGFARKLGDAVTAFVALQLLEHVGYLPGQPQTGSVKLWMLVMYSWFPALFYALALVALARFRFTRGDLDLAQRAVGRAA